MSLIDELAAEHAALPELPPWPELLPDVPAWLLEAPLEIDPPRCEHGCGAVCGAEPRTWVLPEVPEELVELDARRTSPPSLAAWDKTFPGVLGQGKALPTPVPDEMLLLLTRAYREASGTE